MDSWLLRSLEIVVVTEYDLSIKWAKKYLSYLFLSQNYKSQFKWSLSLRNILIISSDGDLLLPLAVVNHPYR